MELRSRGLLPQSERGRPQSVDSSIVDWERERLRLSPRRQDPNYSDVNSEILDSPNLILETSSNDLSCQPRVEKKVKSVTASYRKVSVPKMTEAVLRNIGEESESPGIEEYMYKRGNLVYMYMYKHSPSLRKLERRWDGPFVVIKYVSPSVYLLQEKKKTIIVHRDRLKPCKLEENDLPRWARKVVAHCRESSQ